MSVALRHDIKEEGMDVTQGYITFQGGQNTQFLFIFFFFVFLFSPQTSVITESSFAEDQR